MFKKEHASAVGLSAPLALYYSLLLSSAHTECQLMPLLLRSDYPTNTRDNFRKIPPVPDEFFR